MTATGTVRELVYAYTLLVLDISYHMVPNPPTKKTQSYLLLSKVDSAAVFYENHIILV